MIYFTAFVEQNKDCSEGKRNTPTGNSSSSSKNISYKVSKGQSCRTFYFMFHCISLSQFYLLYLLHPSCNSSTSLEPFTIILQIARKHRFTPIQSRFNHWRWNKRSDDSWTDICNERMQSISCLPHNITPTIYFLTLTFCLQCVSAVLTDIF